MQVVPTISNSGRSSPAMPGTRFGDHLRAAMSTGNGGILRHESPRSHPHTRGQRLPLRPTEGKPSAIRGHCQRTNSPRDDGGKGERRTHQVDARIDQASVRFAERALPPRLNMGQRQTIRFENEAQRRRASATLPIQEAQQDPFGPDMQGCLPCQPAALLLGRQCLGTLQIQLDTGCQGCSRLPQGCAIGGDVEVGTDRLPPIAALSGIASQVQVHFRSPVSARCSRTRGQSTTSVPHWPEFGLRLRRMG